MKKIAADLIATEMFKLLKKASEDNASVNGKNVDEANDHDMVADHDMSHGHDMVSDHDMSDDNMTDDLHSYLTNSADDDSENDVSYVDDEIESMQNMAEDNLMRAHESHQQADEVEDMVATASDMRLMSGLGRIEASLRNKGEGFAADLVRATASSIKQDIVKEAAQRNYVVKNLVKMASELDRKGDRAAARMVKSTIMKINR